MERKEGKMMEIGKQFSISGGSMIENSILRGGAGIEKKKWR